MRVGIGQNAIENRFSSPRDKQKPNSTHCSRIQRVQKWNSQWTSPAFWKSFKHGKGSPCCLYLSDRQSTCVPIKVWEDHWKILCLLIFSLCKMKQCIRKMAIAAKGLALKSCMQWLAVTVLKLHTISTNLISPHLLKIFLRYSLCPGLTEVARSTGVRDVSTLD